MRNLKKVLSLALAMVMLLGMMVIGAGAVETSFADNDKVGETYKEAVAVMTEVGVLTGKENNNFDPEGTLTRAEAAAILVRVTMGTEAAKGLAGVTKSGVFTDMSDHWASGYVDACFNKGIVGGIGNSRFAPDSKLTGTAFAAMLMRAAGVEGDFTGSSWESAVIAAAAKAKLSEVTTGEISRQAAAKMAFDGILYSPSGEKAYKVGNLTFDNFLEAYIANGSKVDGIDVSTASDSLAKSVLGLTEATKEDAFGNPQKVWQVDGKDKVTVPGVKADKFFTEPFTKASDLKDYTCAKDMKVLVDGVENTTVDTVDEIVALGGNGVEVSVYATNKEISKVVVVNPYVGEVKRVTEASGDTKRSVTVDGKKFETEDFDKGDVVIFTKTKGDTETIRSMYQPNMVEGVTVTRTTGTTSFVADGETYKNVKGFTPSVSVNNVVDVYLDQYGFAIKVDVNKGYSDYAYVAGVDSKSSYGNTTKYAILVMTDGTVLKDVVYKDPTGATVAAGDIVTFTKDTKDVYALKIEANKATPGAVTINSGKTGMTLGGGTVYANNRTIFLLENNVSGEWSAYTGYTSVPSITIVSSGDYTVRKTGDLASIVVVREAPMASNTNLFVLKTSNPDKITDEDGTYFVYPAVVDGEITTVKLNSNSFTAGKVYNTVAYANKDAEIIDISACKLNAPAGEESGTVKAEFDEGIIVLNPNKTKSVADDVEVYKLGTTAITVSSIDEIKVGDSVVAVEEGGELISVFYTPKASGSSGGNSGNTGTKTEGIATAPAGATVTVSANKNTITVNVSGDKVNATIPEAQRDDLAGLFPGVVTDATGAVKEQYAIMVLDVLANAPTAPYYNIVQVNNALKVYSEFSSTGKKDKTYNAADLMDGLAIMLKDGEDATLTITGTSSLNGGTGIASGSVIGDVIVIRVKNTATFVCTQSASDNSTADKAVEDTTVHEVVVSDGVTVSKTIPAGKTVVVEENANVTLANTAAGSTVEAKTGSSVTADTVNGEIKAGKDSTVTVDTLAATAKITVPANTTGVEINLAEAPVGNATIEVAADANVTINAPKGFDATTSVVKVEGATVVINVSAAKAKVAAVEFAGKLEITGAANVTIKGDVGNDAVISVKKDAKLNITGKCGAAIETVGFTADTTGATAAAKRSNSLKALIDAIPSGVIHPNDGAAPQDEYYRDTWDMYVFAYDASKAASGATITITRDTDNKVVYQETSTSNPTSGRFYLGINPLGTGNVVLKATGADTKASLEAGTYTVKITAGTTTFGADAASDDWLFGVPANIPNTATVIMEGQFTVSAS